MSNETVHIHNEAIEGILPEGFLTEGREGKVRNVYEAGKLICLIASDRVSAFDQVSPTPIPGKGEILNDIARQELEAAEMAGIPTWFDYVPDTNPRAAVGKRAQVLPSEVIFRNYMTGSMWREYRDTGDFVGFLLKPGMKEWHPFVPPLFTPSTKGMKDINFHPRDVEKMTGIVPATFKHMEEIGRELFKLGTQRAAERGLKLVDTKYEVGVDDDGNIIVLDEVHTPDSSRFVMADGFDEAVASGTRPQSLSKEFLREIMLERSGGDVDKAKELMAQPLDEDIVDELISRYRQLHSIFTA